MRTEQDILNRKRARLKWIQSEHGKKWSQNYMKKYRSRPDVKVKLHEYYIINKMHWGEITKNKQKNNWGTIRQETEDGKRLHEEWAIKNGYRNEDLHATNTKGFKDDEK